MKGGEGRVRVIMETPVSPKERGEEHTEDETREEDDDDEDDEEEDDDDDTNNDDDCSCCCCCVTARRNEVGRNKKDSTSTRNAGSRKGRRCNVIFGSSN